MFPTSNAFGLSSEVDDLYLIGFFWELCKLPACVLWEEILQLS